jgi:hypothetical protein
MAAGRNLVLALLWRAGSSCTAPARRTLAARPATAVAPVTAVPSTKVVK